ncbi:MAG: cytochrome c oxidase subunit II [Ectothiorhodospiraceae bacterium]|nr:cytochrome c oxidase subunit II [Chromatiales bacterium]MCP5156497.1 cytochrome c oxidase subunit II [Ectothiorhodospiraceae bacterium]
MGATTKRRLASAALAIGALAASATARAGYDQLNLPVGVTPISQTAYDLHMLITWICVIIGVAVFGVMFLSIYLHRKSRGVTPAKFHHSTAAEIIWTIIPCVILVGMAYPATKGLIAMEDTSEAEVTIKVTGYQWKWKYEYVEDGITLWSNLDPTSRAAIHGDVSAAENYLLSVDQPLVLPVGKKVRLLITSDDVIHAWWVPQLGMKKDAIPGFVNEMWIRIDDDKAGIYRGQCAELCGKDHGFMPIVVDARAADGYAAWVTERQAAKTAAAPATAGTLAQATAQPTPAARAAF